MKEILGIATLVMVLGGCHQSSAGSSASPVFAITPYRDRDTWVFDDAERDIVKEPFVAGIPEMMDRLVAGIPNARQGFRLFFSDRPFSGYSHKLVLTRKEAGGGWYHLKEFAAEGWLCPTLVKYFSDPPPALYIKAQPLGADKS